MMQFDVPLPLGGGGGEVPFSESGLVRTWQKFSGKKRSDWLQSSPILGPGMECTGLQGPGGLGDSSTVRPGALGLCYQVLIGSGLEAEG